MGDESLRTADDEPDGLDLSALCIEECQPCIQPDCLSVFVLCQFGLEMDVRLTCHAVCHAAGQQYMHHDRHQWQHQYEHPRYEACTHNKPP